MSRAKDDGGLGIKDMGDFNTTLLGKAVWHLLIGSDKLWVNVLSHKYLKQSTILNVVSRPGASPIWHGILKAMDQICSGFQFRLGNGDSSIWYSNWTGCGPLAEHVPFVHISDTNLKLKDVIDNNNWHLERLATVLPDETRNKFAYVLPRLALNSVDNWTWDNTDQWIYSVRDGYSWLRKQRQHVVPDSSWNWVWKLQVPEKVRMFLWLTLHKALPVNANRFRCNLASSEACSRCSVVQEDGLHCLRDCPHSREMWERLGAWRWQNFWTTDLQDWIKTQSRGSNAPRF